jgi:transposase-like protein
MDERMRFVIRLQDGESMAALCREFGISRKTGYKIFERYEQCGLDGLSDRTRRPFRYANQLPEPVEAGSSPPGARNPTGAPARSASAGCDDCRTPSNCPPRAPFTPCSIGTAW